jgi:aspartate/methionine/tyrosine aminotransferase
MRFNTIKYMEWFKTKSRVKIDLCSSSVKQLESKELGISLDELEVTGEDFYGYPPLLQAIARRYEVEEDCIVSTIGTSQALFLVCTALLEPDDEVLIETPVYEPLVAVPEAFGARVMRLARRYEDKYQFSFELFKRLLSPQTRFILLTNLHNPSGVLIPGSHLKQVVQIAGERGIPVVIDEIYLEFLDGEPTSFHLADNIIVISSLTKVFGLGNIRCGWILAQPELAKRLRRIIDYIHVEGVFIAEEIGWRMFGKLDEIKKRNRKLIDTNKSLVRDWIQREKGLSWVEPADGVLCFPRIEGSFDGDELAAVLRKNYDTAVVPGRFFEQTQHFRLAFGGDTDTLAAGLENIGKALKKGI